MSTSNDGHRARLRQKFINNGFDGFLDYEIIELLLTLGIPRKDCKPIAKEFIIKFKTVSGVINAADTELIKIEGLGFASIIGLKIVRESYLYLSKKALLTNSNGINIGTASEYLIAKIGQAMKEHFIVLCCDVKGNIIDDTVTIGTVDASILHPREVFRIAIENNASHIIIAHNHPSGDTTPSDEDIYTTRRLIESGKIIGISIDDHLIVSRDNFTSLKEKGYF